MAVIKVDKEDYCVPVVAADWPHTAWASLPYSKYSTAINSLSSSISLCFFAPVHTTLSDEYCLYNFIGALSVLAKVLDGIAAT